MTFSKGFRQLATALENIESNGLQVLDVATTDDESGDRLTVDLTVAVPLDGAPATETPLADGRGPTAADGDDSAGSAQSTRRTEILDPLPVKTEATNGVSVNNSATEGSTDEQCAEPADQITADPSETESTESTESGADATATESNADDAENSDDLVDCPVEDCDATFESEHGMKIHRTKTHCNERADGNEATAPYRDPDRLREVYAACDSFSEMQAALETDVSAQTVRRQMIAHGIYEPGESGSATDSATGDAEDHPDGEATAESPDETPDERDPEATEDSDDQQAPETEDPELDAIELPDGMTVATLKTTVSEAKTLYDVQQCFDLDREQAMELLRAYDLLDIVHGRVSNRDRRKQVDDEEITRRILEHAPVSQASGA